MGKSEVMIWLNDAREVPGQTHYSCEIGGNLFSRSVKIYGDDAEQATELAYATIRTRLSVGDILDDEGRAIALPKRPPWRRGRRS